MSSRNHRRDASSRTGRRRSTLSPSLFPFLAVLVCTLGTLILMLALVATGAAQPDPAATADPATSTRANGSQSIEDLLAAAVADNPVDAATRTIGQSDFQSEHFAAIRDEQIADLESRRDRLAYLQNEIRELRSKLEQLRDQVDASEIPEADIDQSQIERLRTTLRDETEKLEKLRQAKIGAKPRIVIVPHRGQNGTIRRPIYVVCGPSGVTIMPEGIQISTQQLERSRDAAKIGGDSPLSAALAAARVHVTRYYGDDNPPYPMLVVRPDGIHSYAAARAAMADWDDQFGYELIPNDVDVAYGKSDASLKAAMKTAVDDASLMLDRIRIARGIGHGGGPGMGENAFGNAGTPSSFDDSSRFNESPGMNSDARRRDVDGSSSVASSNGSTTRRGTQPRVISASELTRRTMRAGRGSMIGVRELSAGGRFDALDDPKTQAALDDFLEGRGGSGASDRSSGGGTPFTDGSTDNPRSGMTRSNSAADETADEIIAESFVAQPSVAGNSQAGSADGNDVRSDTGVNAAARGTHASEQNGNQSDAAAGGQGGEMAAGAAGPAPPDVDPTLAEKIDPRSIPQSIRKLDPELLKHVDPSKINWALPDSMRRGGTNVVVRMLGVAVTADSVTLAATGKRGEVVIPVRRGDEANAAFRLGVEVRDVLETWNPAPFQSRWQPKLRVTTFPGGGDVTAAILRHLQRSGLEFQLGGR